MTRWTLPAGSELVPMNRDIIERFYGHPQATSLRGYAACVAGEPLVLIGLRQEAYRWVLFSNAKEEARGAGNFATRRIVLQCVAKLATMFGRIRAPIDAVPEPGIEGAEEFLFRLGFVPFVQGVYRWQAPQPTSRLH